MSQGDVQERAARFAAAIARHVRGGSDILEIGAGEGSLATLLASAGHRVVAIDPQPRGAFPTIATTFEEYDPGADRFDCVAAQFVLHHAADLEAFVAKMARLAGPNGIVAIDDYGWERSGDATFRAERSDLHTAEKMLEILDRSFDRIFYENHGYSWEGYSDSRLAFIFMGKSLGRIAS